jgi:hypothetical protein
MSSMAQVSISRRHSKHFWKRVDGKAFVKSASIQLSMTNPRTYLCSYLEAVVLTPISNELLNKHQRKNIHVPVHDDCCSG